jgi:hypothetical protein
MSEQAPDPFENYAEQEHSYDLLGRHGEGLIEEALEYLREKPDGHPVGVIITLDAPEAAPFLNPTSSSRRRRAGAASYRSSR